LLALSMSACVSPATNVVFVIDSDVSPSRVTLLRARLFDPSTGALLREPVLFPREGVSSTLSFPASFTVVPGAAIARDGVAEVRLELSATRGRRDAGDPDPHSALSVLAGRAGHHAGVHAHRV
jgi:hypothetical protein